MPVSRCSLYLCAKIQRMLDINYLRSNTDAEIVVPDTELINFKEALVFALMGVLRIQNKPNVLAGLTGADSDSIGGSLHGNFSHLA